MISKMRARAGIVLAAALCALQVASLQTTATAAAGARPPAVPHIAWAACGNGFECATVAVPRDYDRPAGATISLALIRLPAGRPAQRIGSLFINPGGPGGSGVDVVREVGKFLPPQLRARFDIVGFDPRGIIRSTPLRCFPTFRDALAVRPPFPYPVAPREEARWRASDAALASACARRGGPILAHMSTADTARDMNLLRRAVGDRALNYLGFSYGSFLGQTYANLFPDKVRALVIDGVLDPIAWTTGRGDEARTLPFSYRLHSDVGAARTLGEFFRRCDEAGPSCAFSGHARQRYAALVQRLRRHPVAIPHGPRVTDQILIAVTLGYLYAPITWPELAQALAMIEAAATPAAIGRVLARARDTLGLAAGRQQPYPNYVEGGSGVFCSDSVNPDSFAAWRRAADQAERRHGYFGRLWTWVSSVCLPWPEGAGQDRYRGPWTARTASPVLVVGNYFDPATPYRGAVTAARLLPNSRLLSCAGWGHTAYGSGNFCVDSTVTRYLMTTQVPPAGTVCRPEGSPFGSANATAAARAKGATVGRLLPEAVRHAITSTAGMTGRS